jgi:hypothetical protein
MRDGAVEADGKPARAKLKVNRLREARKRQTERETLAGSPKRSDGARDNLREARKRETGRERLAGSPRERNSENDARGKPAERFLNV